MREGKFQGDAIMRYVNGDTFTGNMLDDRWQNEAKRVTTTGDTFEGIKVDGRWEGPCAMAYTNGDRLEGMMHDGGTKVDGVWQGAATMHYANGTRLDGTLVNGQFQGAATRHCAGGDRLGRVREPRARAHSMDLSHAAPTPAAPLPLIGTLADGRWQGDAVKHFASGDRLDGKVDDTGGFQGDAVLRYAGGDVLQGRKLDDRWPACRRFADGGRLVGAYKDGKWPRVLRGRGPRVGGTARPDPAASIDGKFEGAATRGTMTAGEFCGPATLHYAAPVTARTGGPLMRRR
eukprot:gene24555-64277_t